LAEPKLLEGGENEEVDVSFGVSLLLYGMLKHVK